jgi:hypothetical protein
VKSSRSRLSKICARPWYTYIFSLSLSLSRTHNNNYNNNNQQEQPHQSPYDNLVQLSQQFAKTSCIDVDFQQMIAQLKNVTQWGETGVGIRQWTYQTCAEFGFFQVC